MVKRRPTLTQLHRGPHLKLDVDAWWVDRGQGWARDSAFPAAFVAGAAARV